MNLNRFFFRCPSCFLKFTADVEGGRAPVVEMCPVCQDRRFRCLGSTRGVLSLKVPCNDACVFAEGPHCSCSCGGKNHGSKLLVPVRSGVVEFSGQGPLWMVDEIRRKWVAWQAELSAMEMGRPPRVVDAFRAGRAGTEEQRRTARAWSDWWSALRFGCDSWAARDKKLALFRKAFPDAGRVEPVAGSSAGLSAVSFVAVAAPVLANVGQLDLF